MAELTYLNEASVVHNLQTRYQADLIYVSALILEALKTQTNSSTDIFGTILGHSQPLLPAAHLLARLHQHV